ncbi:hypothetical protein M407DRAFT_124161 [Tulasnella calospora MUT 4182]|uniref:Uncharacterized protein n=1 Tax=Tulasnella calospora MUT 4182 TaxID=1051891 RepID=A0A0C3LCS7_9AGAM|nr:hypothetical protein M407DRAFT_124161 [Tulasnella calospora MUT 4182]
MPVNKGDVLVIPAPNDKYRQDENKMTIHWQQTLRQREGDYYLLVAKNKTQGYAEVPFYIQAEWYNQQGFNNAYDMRRIDEDNYEITIDNRHQYAGKERARFVVWHDQERKPYADRFIDTGVLKRGTEIAKKVLSIYGLGGSGTDTVVDSVSKFGQSVMGDYLRTF